MYSAVGCVAGSDGSDDGLSIRTKDDVEMQWLSVCDAAMCCWKDDIVVIDVVVCWWW